MGQKVLIHGGDQIALQRERFRSVDTDTTADLLGHVFRQKKGGFKPTYPEQSGNPHRRQPMSRAARNNRR